MVVSGSYCQSMIYGCVWLLLSGQSMIYSCVWLLLLGYILWLCLVVTVSL